MGLEISQKLLGLMFVYAAVAGFFLGGVYDVLRISRILCGDDVSRTGKRPLPLRILLFGEDTVFALIGSLILILLLYYTNDGQFRASAVFGMACGFFVYYHTVGRLVMLCVEAIVRALRKLFRVTVKVLLWPIRRLGRLVAALARYLWAKTAGKVIEKRRERETDRRIRALTEAASHGFGLGEADREKK